MFNLARFKMRFEDSDEDKILKAVHKNKRKTRDASVQDDAGNLARLCAQTDQEPEAIMAEDDYWSWVRTHDKHYYRDVVKKAKGIAAQMKSEAEHPNPNAKYVPPVPIPKQQEGGGGGGGMPAMAASRPVMFLKRNSPYRLMGTIIGDMMSGNLPFLKEDGMAFLMEVKDDSSVDRFGPSAIEALKIQEALPEAMRSAARKFIESMGRDDASSLARSLIARYLRKKKLDLLPLSVAMKGERFGFLLRLGLETEPPECQALREEMGKAIAPMIFRFRGALSIEGIDTTESPAQMPVFTPQGREAIENPSTPFDDPSASPAILDGEDLDDSVDIPSLVMTITAPDSDDDKRAKAAGRLVEIICKMPSIYERYELSDSDVKAMTAAAGQNPAVARLSMFARLFRADDAGVMEAYSTGEDRGLVASLIGSQGRREIIDAVPEMCYQGGDVVPEFMEKIDAGSGPGASFLSSLVPGEGSECPEKLLSRKIIEAIWKNPNGEIVERALKSFPMARDFAILTLMESSPEMANKAMEGLVGFASDSTWHGVLLASACAKKGDEAMMRFAYFGTGAKPIDVMEFAGRKSTVAYMRANRINADGEPIPEAAEILSSPEDPLPLAKSLNAMQDAQSMLILMRACARKARGGHAKRMWYAMSFMNDALRAMGRGASAEEVMRSSGVSIDDARGTVKRIPKETRVAAVDGSVMVGKYGVYIHEGRAYACDVETAASIPVIAGQDLGRIEEKKY